MAFQTAPASPNAQRTRKKLIGQVAGMLTAKKFPAQPKGTPNYASTFPNTPGMARVPTLSGILHDQKISRKRGHAPPFR